MPLTPPMKRRSLGYPGLPNVPWLVAARERSTSGPGFSSLLPFLAQDAHPRSSHSRSASSRLAHRPTRSLPFGGRRCALLAPVLDVRVRAHLLCTSERCQERYRPAHLGHWQQCERVVASRPCVHDGSPPDDPAYVKFLPRDAQVQSVAVELPNHALNDAQVSAE